MAHGFRGVTMDDLAAELGMSKKTLYAHFSSKSVLLDAVIEDKLRSADADLSAITDRCAADFDAALHALLATVRRHGEELQPAFLRDVARETPELFQRVQAGRRALIQRHFGKLLGEGRKTGMIRKDIEADLMIEILVGAMDALINPQKLTQLGLSAKTGLSTIVTIFLEGVLTGKKGTKR
jgi:AcrR family transcriptional regulator